MGSLEDRQGPYMHAIGVSYTRCQESTQGEKHTPATHYAHFFRQSAFAPPAALQSLHRGSVLLILAAGFLPFVRKLGNLRNTKLRKRSRSDCESRSSLPSKDPAAGLWVASLLRLCSMTSSTVHARLRSSASAALRLSCPCQPSDAADLDKKVKVSLQTSMLS